MEKVHKRNIQNNIPNDGYDKGSFSSDWDTPHVKQAR